MGTLSCRRFGKAAITGMAGCNWEGSKHGTHDPRKRHQMADGGRGDARWRCVCVRVCHLRCKCNARHSCAQRPHRNIDAGQVASGARFVLTGCREGIVEAEERKPCICDCGNQTE